MVQVEPLGRGDLVYTCKRCGNPVHSDDPAGSGLCDSCLDWVYFGYEAYKPEAAGYLTGEDLTDIELGRRTAAEVFASRGRYSGPPIRLSLPDLRIPENKVLVQVFRECDTDLVSWLAQHPQDLYAVHPGTFELIVARIFRSRGFEVEVISSWNQPDGGVDLIAARRVSGMIDLRIAVQCKRHASTHRVSAEPVRSLNGVLDRFRAHRGVIATTSEFTRDAWHEVGEYFWRIELLDHQRIVSALKELGLVDSSDPPRRM
jgi:hypothetical protein